MFVTPGVVVDGKAVTHDLIDINLGIRILLGSSYYDSWENSEMFVEKDPLGNPVDVCHARRGGGRQGSDARSDRHQSRNPHFARQFLLRQLGKQRNVCRERSAGQPGRCLSRPAWWWTARQ